MTAQAISTNDLKKQIENVQLQRGNIAALEYNVSELKRLNETAALERAQQPEGNRTLQVALEEQKAISASIERGFTAYKQKYTLGGELAALQQAVAGVQAQLGKERGRENR